MSGETKPAKQSSRRKSGSPAGAAPDPARLFPFPLDPFQQEAIRRLDEGHSVLVCAPTGAGKTVIAEYAVHLALAEGRRVFYTTPLKALSNQKYRDLGRMIGADRVGLLTGDISINREAPVVVMTTEVYRNMLYGTSLGAVETNLAGVRFVILDEVHYMNDEQRGTVWEESIIYSPTPVQLVALSATVANAPDMAHWMGDTHGDTSLVTTDFRPVPLRFYYYDGRRLATLGKALPAQATRTRIDPATGRRLKRWELVPDPDAAVAELAAREMLPAIYFVFSRKGCESALLACARLQLLSPEEVDLVEGFVDDYCREYPSAAQHPHMPYLFRGAAVHHAGLLPTWKVLVERLFQANLVKVVFATETLAAGINMPARTTVLSAISKRADEGIRLLTASEFLQMSGRAGRRGMDTLGHVVVVQSPFRTVADAQRLAAAPPDPLGSRFTPTYGMVLNLLQRHTLDECRFLISRSFGEFLESQKRRKHRGGAPEEPHNWTRFVRLKEVLQAYGYVDADHPTPRGVTAAAIRSEHELLVAESLLCGALDGLSPPALAATVTSLVTEELRPSAWVKARLSPPVAGTVRELVRRARDIRMTQNRCRIDVPTRVHSAACGLTERWAEGCEWEELSAVTNLDDGDLVRIFRRTLDLLEQVVHAPMVESPLRDAARAAADALNREPVREVL